ncbi:bifunctional folylpolyglutamate synthase/dihydrofolate synthase [Anaerosacchariphilus polymeriproducens]|uniref:tetrahydrofolate synthase n=1 Tax=Anaerosacchariphilus polymeriproducens TaxID=1812858 RepID=A0A371ARQ4_9FIRM|nr:folylpolyglutamate synthase/dihydrofolate synthase family protein [Anaerosacchariphilus polymeriproducens]RDU22259.1 bifunctional folylpolyglutamate synthase/dihydrofolate synthase [Anaerosacchariphilus polymeriproducens]
MNYEETVEYIMGISKFTKKHTLDNTKQLLKELGSPEKKLKIIHVAGTNGKGSVCAYLASLLSQTERKVGLFTSPHLEDIRERIKINGEMISKEIFLEAFQSVEKIANKMEEQGYHYPNFFEFIFAMSLFVFRKEKVEYAVLETGLGGELDATNAVEKPVAAIITSISLDHTDILGDSIEKIAKAKAGIIKPHIPIIFDGNNETAARVIERKAEECLSPNLKITKDSVKISKITEKNIDFYFQSSYYCTSITVPFVAKYQVMNAALAIKALETLEISREISTEQLRSAIINVKWEGRMEQVLDGVILDGAHNEDGVKAFLETANELVKGRKLIILFSALKDKYYKKMIERIATGLSPECIIVTQISNERAASMNELETTFRKYTESEIIAERKIETAFSKALEKKGENGIVFAVGSLYMIGELKGVIRRYYHD